MKLSFRFYGFCGSIFSRCLIIIIYFLVLTVVLAKEETNVCTNDQDKCKPISCLKHWFYESDKRAIRLIGAAVMLFCATFLPRVLVQVIIILVTKLPIIRQTGEDFKKFCTNTTSYLVSAALVWGAITISELDDFLCLFPRYVFSIFVLIWAYSLFHVIESFAIRRFVGIHGDFSKKMVIAESVKILRLIALVLLALILFSPAWGSNDLLKFSVLCVIGLAIALGFVPAFHNVIGGLFLAFNAQFKVDDFIEVGNAKGFVHRVALRYTTIITMNGTKVFVPNSFFLYKPMVNFTQRPKQEIDLTVSVATTTPVDKLRMCIERIEQMLKSLHLGLTSHEENNNDSRQGEKWERFFFVAMEELFKIHVFSYTDELDPRKHAMIKSEVWLAVMEIMEELKIEVINKPPKSQQDLIHHEEDDDTPSPFSAEMNLIIGNSNNKRYH